MKSPETYRKYAEDCRRLAEKAAPKDKAVLLEIASAWDQCAKDAGSESKRLKLRSINGPVRDYSRAQ
jgi:hypothetical protein